MKGHEKEMDNMKETELNAHVRKWNADNLEEKNHEKLSLLPLLICFFGLLWGIPVPDWLELPSKYFSSWWFSKNEV